MLLVARIVAQAALRRTESRGAHQREDFPGQLPQWRVNQVVRWNDGRIELTSTPVAAADAPVPTMAARAMTASATLRIWRGHDADPARFETYEVPFEPGQSVLDGLRWMRQITTRRWRSGSPASMPMPARNA